MATLPAVVHICKPTFEARAAAALFDSISRWVPEVSSPSATARATAWALTPAATALAQAGDTVRLTRGCT